MPPIPTELTPDRLGPCSGSGQAVARPTRWNGESSKPSSGCGRPASAFGTSVACSSMSTDLISAATPAAASRWPMFDFTEPIPIRPVPSAP